MANQEVVKRARSAFKEILNEMEHPQFDLLRRDPEIKNLVERLDDYEKKHPEDSNLWVWLFLHAAFVNSELADVLCFLRGRGCVLIPDDRFGYVIRPIIGKDGFKSQEEYNQIKEPLADYGESLVKLLKKMKALVDCGNILPQKELTQTTLKGES